MFSEIKISNAISVNDRIKTKYFIKMYIIYLKNEAFCDISHHQVIYLYNAKIKILNQSKNFYIQLKRTIKSLKYLSSCYTVSEKH